MPTSAESFELGLYTIVPGFACFVGPSADTKIGRKKTGEYVTLPQSFYVYI
jgi:hypothetical protein